MKKLIIFDLDGTLAESKSPLSHAMAESLKFLLERYHVAVISGGAYIQFEKQFLIGLNLPEQLLRKLYLFPTCATSFYRYDDRWVRVYSEKLTPEEQAKILDAFQQVILETNFNTVGSFGDVLENRGSQITFSALGQSAPIEIKRYWDPDQNKRIKFIDKLKNLIPEFEIRIGGATSIDVTKKNIDKAYGIFQIEKHLGFQPSEMLFIGDALYEGGNDAPVKSTGVECLQTSGPEETINIINKEIARYDFCSSPILKSLVMYMEEKDYRDLKEWSKKNEKT